MRSSMSVFRRSLCVAAGALLWGACNPLACLPSLELPDAGFPSLHGTEEAIVEELVVQGRVSLQQEGQQATARSGVSVRLSVDADGNGALSADEQVQTTTDSDGKYRLQKAVTPGSSVVLRYQDDDAVTVHRTIKAGPKANVRLNVTLVPALPLACTGGNCAVADKRLAVAGLPGGVGGRARLFNPTTERDQFPGNFDDAAGNLLISGVFATVALTDGSGQPVSTLGSPARLTMTLPRETWRVVKDIHPGTARIEVPMYAFDDVAGTWRAEGEGVLEDGTGRVFTEADLAGIRAGTFQGAVIAAATVSHFSSWNVDWPVDTKGCITGMVLDREGQPAEGATVFASGTTYDGQSPGITVGADGRFCVDVMRSEGSGEDVDQDGVTGETQSVKIRVAHRGLLYDLGEFATPTAQGTCAAGTCLDIGSLRISQDNELIPVSCAYAGTVHDHAGVPVQGATVMGFDPALDPEMMMSVCFGGALTTPCEFVATTGADGRYSVRTAIVDGVSLFATKTQEITTGRTRMTVGATHVRGCPGTPADIEVEVFDTVQLTVSVAGSSMAWTPVVGAASLLVTRGGDPLWTVNATADGGFLPPVTYGTAPAGALATTPDGGPAAPLAAGDSIMVFVGGTSPEGYPYAGSGQTTVP